MSRDTLGKIRKSETWDDSMTGRWKTRGRGPGVRDTGSRGVEENHSNANEPGSGFLLHGAPIFRSNLRVFFSFEKEIMK